LPVEEVVDRLRRVVDERSIAGWAIWERPKKPYIGTVNSYEFSIRAARRHELFRGQMARNSWDPVLVGCIEPTRFGTVIDYSVSLPSWIRCGVCVWFSFIAVFGIFSWVMILIDGRVVGEEWVFAFWPLLMFAVGIVVMQFGWLVARPIQADLEGLLPRLLMTDDYMSRRNPNTGVSASGGAQLQGNSSDSQKTSPC
jgi:hypothetical protein